MLSKNTRKFKFFIKDYGCKINQYDSKVISQNLIKQGKQEADLEEADIVIVNTCSVTQRATKEASRFIKKLKKNYKDKEVLAIGCSTRECIDGFPSDVKIHPGFIYLDHPASLLEDFKGHSRAFVKVQQGCHASCSYCVVNRLKKPFYLKSVSSVIEETKILSKKHSEIVYSATNFNEYSCLKDLVKALGKTKDIKRWRFSSIPPGVIDKELLEMLSEDPAFCRHLHIPIQSASDRVLKAMHRPYSQSQLYELVEQSSKILGDLGFSFDVILGFPGETEEDFQQTMCFIKDVRPVRIHSFRYSERPNTRAFDYADKIAENIKSSRHSELVELMKKIEEAHYISAVGKTYEVVLDTRKSGYTREYLPVHAESFVGEIPASGMIVNMFIKSYDAKGLKACIAD